MAEKKFGVSPLTNTIYYGNVSEKTHNWTGEKKNVTDGAIAAVYEWFMYNMEDEKGKKLEYSITYPNTEFELVMRRKEGK